MKINLIWIDENIDSKDYTKYIEELIFFGSFQVKLFINSDKAIDYLKTIEFQETKLIISGKIYYEFISKFKDNIIDMRVAPKIIIFTDDKQKFIANIKDLQIVEINKLNNTFYYFGGIVDTFQEIKKFLKIENKFEKLDDARLTFEYIDSKEKLLLPLFFETLIDSSSENNIDNYTNYLYEKFQKVMKK